MNDDYGCNICFSDEEYSDFEDPIYDDDDADCFCD